MIGIFDSGSGGLSVLAALRLRAPSADIVYFGDILNAPYGSRSQEELAALVVRGMRILTNAGANEIVAACNSVSLSVLAGAAGHDRIIEMTRPTARMMRSYAGQRVLLLATPATIASHIYRDALKPIVALDELAVSGLAGAIENGASDDAIVGIVREALEERRANSYDAVLLGCTHYPLMRDHIAREVRALFGAIPLIDPADAVAEEAVQRFEVRGSGTLRFLLSRDSAIFRAHVARLFPDAQCTITII